MNFYVIKAQFYNKLNYFIIIFNNKILMKYIKIIINGIKTKHWVYFVAII